MARGAHEPLATRSRDGARADFDVALRLRTLEHWEIDFVPDESAPVDLSASLSWPASAPGRFDEDQTLTVGVKGLSTALPGVRGELHMRVQQQFKTHLLRLRAANDEFRPGGAPR